MNYYSEYKTVTDAMLDRWAESIIAPQLDRIAIDYPIRLEDVLAIHTITGKIAATRQFAQLTQLGYAMHEIKQRAMRMYHTLPHAMDYDSGMEAQWQEANQ